MALPDKGGRIADPVHGYISFTRLERVVFEQKVAQRLRYISQNGLASLIYPEAKSSRFVHSLGVMHLLSSALSSSLRNTQEPTKAALLNALKALTQQIAGTIGEPKTAAQHLSDQDLLADACVPELYRPVVILVEQAMRLAAFFHDLGHLPFSHDFESGLENFWRDLDGNDNWKKKLEDLVQFQPGRAMIHERVGHAVSKLIFRDVFASWTGDEKEAIRITFELAQKVLDCVPSIPISPTVEQAALEWLHSLIDGEVDVDRCDYILRDGRNHGFEFVNYDLIRLLDNLVVAEQNGRFVSAIKPQGLSSVESFILSRFRHYKYGIRHHKVAQVGAALRFAIESTLRAKSPQVEKFVDDLVTIATGEPSPSAAKDILERFAFYDDVWWMSLMRQHASSSPNEWLALVCWRGKGPRSLWKRIEQFPSSVSEFNEALPERIDLDKQELWSEALKELRIKDTLVVRHNFEPWRASDTGESVFCMQAGLELKPISLLSPLVKALPEAWTEDVQVHAFCTSTSTCSPADVVDRLKEAIGLK